MIWLVTVVVPFMLYLWKTGLHTTEVNIEEDPKSLRGSVVIYYKHVVGSYFTAYQAIREAQSFITGGVGIGISICYDDPEEVPTHLLQSAVGLVVQRNGEKLVDSATVEMLAFRGYKALSLPSIERAVVATIPMSHLAACLPICNPFMRTYSAIKQFVQERGLCTQMSIEVYEGDNFTAHFPLVNMDAFIVPERMAAGQYTL